MGEMISETVWTVPLPDGDVLLMRPETEADALFLKTLFVTVVMGQMGLQDAAGMEPLIDLQRHSREQTYAAIWPHARRWIIEHDGSPIGSLIEGDKGDAVHMVDLSLLPQVQGQGLGSAVLADAQSRAAARGKAVTAMVMVSNVASLALVRRRGFTGSTQHGDAQIGVRWTP